MDIREPGSALGGDDELIPRDFALQRLRAPAERNLTARAFGGAAIAAIIALLGYSAGRAASDHAPTRGCVSAGVADPQSAPARP